MSRRQKFKVGDLVVLKRAARVDDYPGNVHWEDGLKDVIQDRESIRSIVRSTSIYGANRVIQGGKVGVVKAYQNVFMLDRKSIVKDTYNKLPAAIKRQAVPLKTRHGQVDRYMLNLHKRNHLIVLIDGSLIAFAHGAKMFETADETMARYPEVVVTFQGEIAFRNVSQQEIDKKVLSKLATLRGMLVNPRLINTAYKDRDGNEREEAPSDEGAGAGDDPTAGGALPAAGDAGGSVLPGAQGMGSPGDGAEQGGDAGGDVAAGVYVP